MLGLRFMLSAKTIFAPALTKAKADEKKAHRKEEEEKRRERIRSRREEEYSDEDKYEIISADSIEELIQKLEEYNQELGLTSDAETSGIYMDYQA